MTYSQAEVDMLLEENQQELMRKLETISKEARKNTAKERKVIILWSTSPYNSQAQI